MAAVTVERVDPARQRRLLITAAEAAHAGEAHYVAPLRYGERRALDPGLSPFLRDNPTAFFIARLGGRPVGRIAAIENRAHLARHGDGTGHFGFLDVPDDTAVTEALMAAAADWLKRRGLDRMAGPFSASINHSAGVLVEGFDTPSSVHTPYNGPHLEAHLRRLGFAPLKDLFAFRARVADAVLPRRVAAMRERFAGARQVRLRTFDTARFEAETKVLNALYNDAWSGNWGAVPLCDEEALFLGTLVRPLARTGWTVFAECGEEIVGAAAMVPDLNEAIAPLRGRLFPFGWAVLLHRLGPGRLSRARVPLIGVARRLRATRLGGYVAAALLARMVEEARAARIAELEISWMLADNRRILNLVAALPARHAKTWRLYVKNLR